MRARRPLLLLVAGRVSSRLYCWGLRCHEVGLRSEMRVLVTAAPTTRHSVPSPERTGGDLQTPPSRLRQPPGRWPSTFGHPLSAQRGSPFRAKKFGAARGFGYESESSTFHRDKVVSQLNQILLLNIRAPDEQYTPINERR